MTRERVELQITTPRRRHGLLTEVAKAAGVSVPTVSKVVNNRPGVGPQTRSRIEELLLARGFRDARSRQVYVVFRDLAGPYTLEVARGVLDAAAAVGVECVTGTTSSRSVGAWLDAAETSGAVGVILVISMLTDQDQRRVISGGVPVVLLDPLNEPDTRIPSIGVTNWRGARAAVMHLLDQGHTRIGMVAGRPSSPAGAARLHGYRSALNEAGLPDGPELVRASDFDYEEGIRAARSLLTLSERPTAIFAASDAQALGVLEAARQVGLSVPQQLSVVSFDDTAVAAMASPPLTAVRQPFEELGRVATRTLLDVAEGRQVGGSRLELATTLTVRESTAAPAQL